MLLLFKQSMLILQLISPTKYLIYNRYTWHDKNRGKYFTRNVIFIPHVGTVLEAWFFSFFLPFFSFYGITSPPLSYFRIQLHICLCNKNKGRLEFRITNLRFRLVGNQIVARKHSTFATLQIPSSLKKSLNQLI